MSVILKLFLKTFNLMSQMFFGLGHVIIYLFNWINNVLQISGLLS